MTIKVKLRLIFAIFVMILLGVSLYSKDSLSYLESSIKLTSNNLLPTQNILQSIQSNIRDFRINESSYILSTSFNDMDNLENRINVFAKKIAALFKDYSEITNTDEEKRIFFELQDQWEKYLEVNRQLLQVSRKDYSAGDVNSLIQSTNIFHDQSKLFYDKIMKDLNHLLDLNAQQTNKSNVDSLAFAADVNLILFFAIIASLCTCLMIIFVLEKNILGFLYYIISIAGRLIKGETNLVIEGKERQDEFGEMANALEVFKNNALEKINLDQERREVEFGSKQEKEQIKTKLAKDFETSVQTIITTVASAATELFYAAENMQQNISSVNKEASLVASTSSQASSNVVTVAAAVEEMSVSIKDISNQVSKTSVLMTDAVNKTTEANHSVKLLTDAVTEIDEILKMIDDIAKQINLLALNATIESARAGEAGKGFAVVASEIKDLADQTAEATDTISKHIENINKVSEIVVLALNKIEDSIGNVSSYATGISSAVQEQSIATNEISTNMHSASKGVQNIASSVAVISKGASEADNSAKGVLDSSQMLSKQSETLNLQVKKFLDSIKISE